MPTLTFRIKKRPDASAMLVLVREDGPSTSGPIGPPQGYGPVHDLAHYVVKHTLGLTHGFCGLVASGELSRRAMMWQWSTAEDFVWAVEKYMKQSHPNYAMPEIGEQTFERIGPNCWSCDSAGTSSRPERRGNWR